MSDLLKDMPQEALTLFLFGCSVCGLLAFFGLAGEIVSWMLDD